METTRANRRWREPRRGKCARVVPVHSTGVSGIYPLLKAIEHKMSEKDSGNVHYGAFKADSSAREGQKVAFTPIRLARIKLRMTELAMGQAALAAGAGMTPSAISLILSGKTNTTRQFAALAQALHVNMAWLLGDTEQQINMTALDGSPITEAALPELLKIEDFVRQRAAHVPTSDDECLKVEIEADMVALREIDLPQQTRVIHHGLPVKARHRFFSRDLLNNYSRADAHYLMVVQDIGDAMQPTVIGSDMLLIDTSRQSLDVSDKLWVYSYAGTCMVTRLRPIPNGVRLITDNPNLPDDTAQADDLQIMGLVVGLIRKL